MSNKMLEKKLLLLIKVSDGCWVLSPEEAHMPKQDYKDEARGFFARLLLRTRKRSLRDEALDILANIVGFRWPHQTQSLRIIQDDGIEWHPVILRLDEDTIFEHTFIIDIQARNKKVEMTLLEEHPFAEKLRSRLT